MPVQPTQAMNPVVARLFKAIGQNQPVANNVLRRGSLIAFGYNQWKHDPYPLVIVTDFIPGVRVRGVNLHYLTFTYIKNLLRMGSNNLGFNYRNIKGNAYITDAFRTYKWRGIKQVRMFDANFLLTVMASVRTFDPTQVVAIRKAVQDQIKREINPKASVAGVTNVTRG